MMSESINDKYIPEIAQNMRFYGDMRFKQLTLLLTFMSIAAAGVANYSEIELIKGVYIKLVVSIGSVLFTSLMWIMEVRSTLSWVEHRKAVPNIWPRPNTHFRFVNATNSVFVLHLIIFSFWSWLSYIWSGNKYLVILFILLGLFLFVFTCVNYWSLWTFKKAKKEIESDESST